MSTPPTGALEEPPAASRPSGPTRVSWLSRHRRLSLLALAVAVVVLVAVLDWPHRATTGQLRSDLASYATQVRGDVTSCSVEVENTLSAYNQITAGASTDRSTALAIAEQTALDCTPMGNSRIDDVGTLQAPRSLERFGLDAASQLLYQWCFPGGVDVAQDIQRLLGHPGEASTLADVHARLQQLSTLAGRAQHAFDAAANALGMAPVPFGLDEVRPGVLVG